MSIVSKAVLRGISSMATRQVLADLAQAWQQAGGAPVEIESVGGVEAAKRVQEGEAFDVVFLAADAIDKLVAAGKAVAGSRVDLVNSGVAVAVKAGEPRPDIGTEEDLRAAVLAAPSIGYSTGPSGTALLKLFERWGIATQLQPRLKQARPGVPVGTMVASGEAALGFQQLSELIHVEGISLLGPMPAPVQIDTVFSGAACATARDPQTVRALLEFMASPAADEAKRRQGMQPA